MTASCAEANTARSLSICLAPEAWRLSRLLYSCLWSQHYCPWQIWCVLPQPPTANGPCLIQTQRTQLPAQASPFGRSNQIGSSLLNRAKTSVLITFLSVVQILRSGTLQGTLSLFSHPAALLTLKYSSLMVLPQYFQIFNFSDNRFLDPSLHPVALA